MFVNYDSVKKEWQIRKNLSPIASQGLNSRVEWEYC